MTSSLERLRNPRTHVLLAAVLAIGVAVFLSWPALTQADRFHENWRQTPHWLSPDKQHFQEDDLLVRYAAFGTTPFGNALYQTLARTGHDVVWGKVMTIVVFVAAALSCFLVARAMAGLPAGWVAVVLFLFFPSMYEHFVGGFMACFSWPLLAAGVYVIYRQRWWWAIPLVMLGGLVYPMVGIHIGMMFLLDTVASDLRVSRLGDRARRRAFLRNKLLPLTLAALALAAVLGSKYLEDHPFGNLVTRADMQDRVEFTKHGRYRILPTTALWTRFERHWENPFHLSIALLAVLFLGRGAFRLPRGLYALLAASIVMYYLADVSVMRLYLPSRYIRRAFPLFTCLVAGVWWARIYYDLKRSKPAMGAQWQTRRLMPLVVGTALLAGVGVREFAGELEPGAHTHVYDRHDLYAAIRALPGRPMIAAWPRLASELPLMTGRTVLVNKEQAHPWWTNLWDEVTERTHEFWRAYYTADPDEFRRVVDKYGIDYWIVEHRYFSANYLRRRKVHFEPFKAWLNQLRRDPRPLLGQVPRAYRLYEDGQHMLVSSADVFRWLETR